METPPPLSPPSLPRTVGLATASLVLGILSVTCLSILTGIPALILGIMALNRVKNSAGRLTGKGQSIAGIVMGGVSLALLPFTLAFAAGLFLPAYVSARAKAHEAQCLNNVRQCTLACVSYAREHDTALPNSWDDMKKFLGNEAAAQQILHCPAEPGSATSYEIVNPGKRLADLGPPNETVVVREINAPHRGKRAVGFADGHVEMQAGTR